MLEEHVGGSHGGVAAQVHLLVGGEPAQIEAAVLSGNEVGRFREIVLGGDVLQLRVVDPLFQRADGGGVAGEELVREDVDLIEGDLHGDLRDRRKKILLLAKPRENDPIWTIEYRRRRTPRSIEAE